MLYALQWHRVNIDRMMHITDLSSPHNDLLLLTLWTRAPRSFSEILRVPKGIIELSWSYTVCYSYRKWHQRVKSKVKKKTHTQKKIQRKKCAEQDTGCFAHVIIVWIDGCREDKPRKQVAKYESHHGGVFWGFFCLFLKKHDFSFTSRAASHFSFPSDPGCASVSAHMKTTGLWFKTHFHYFTLADIKMIWTSPGWENAQRYSVSAWCLSAGAVVWKQSGE